MLNALAQDMCLSCGRVRHRLEPKSTAAVTGVRLKLLQSASCLYPLQSNILEIEIQTAARVAKLVFDAGLARVPRPTDVVAFIRKQVYTPQYSDALS
jgi:malate dehydrogenase (oxaloacetate-decarboxylating)(NADP+)